MGLKGFNNCFMDLCKNYQH